MRKQRSLVAVIPVVLVLAGCGDGDAHRDWASLRSGDTLFSEVRQGVTEAAGLGLESPYLDHPWQVVACRPASGNDGFSNPHRTHAFAGRISAEWRRPSGSYGFPSKPLTPDEALETVLKDLGLLSPRSFNTSGAVTEGLPAGVAALEFAKYGVDDAGRPVETYKATTGTGLTLTLTTQCFVEDGVVAEDMVPPKAHDRAGRPVNRVDPWDVR